MRIKLDENLGRRGVEALRQHGHDVSTVAEQGMCAFDDNSVIDVCQREDRCLVTLDTDFSNPIAYPPGRYEGLAVIRLPRRAEPTDLAAAFDVLGTALAVRSVRGRLWIVGPARIREYAPGGSRGRAGAD